MVFRHALARKPANSVAQGLTSANLGAPDPDLCAEQHDRYVAALRKCGLETQVLTPAEPFPDSVFLEDVAVCTPKMAVITRPGAASRQGEADLILPVLADYYEAIDRIESPGTLDAGDVMMVGDHYFIGHSARTNRAGAEQLLAILKRFGMTGEVIELSEMLHLKTGLAYLENDWLAVCGEFVHHPAFSQYRLIEIPTAEAYAANCIWVNGSIIMPAGHPEAHARLSQVGLPIIEVDTSEFQKLDGGVSCLSLRF